MINENFYSHFVINIYNVGVNDFAPIKVSVRNETPCGGAAHFFAGKVVSGLWSVVRERRFTIHDLRFTNHKTTIKL